MAGTGVLAVFVATVAMPSSFKGTSWAIALAGTLTVALISAVNFALDSGFKWLLLAPAVIWLAGLVLHVAGRGRVFAQSQAIEAGETTMEPP